MPVEQWRQQRQWMMCRAGGNVPQPSPHLAGPDPPDVDAIGLQRLVPGGPRLERVRLAHVCGQAVGTSQPASESAQSGGEIESDEGPVAASTAGGRGRNKRGAAAAPVPTWDAPHDSLRRHLLHNLPHQQLGAVERYSDGGLARQPVLVYAAVRLQGGGASLAAGSRRGPAPTLALLLVRHLPVPSRHVPSTARPLILCTGQDKGGSSGQRKSRTCCGQETYTAGRLPLQLLQLPTARRHAREQAGAPSSSAMASRCRACRSICR